MYLQGLEHTSIQDVPIGKPFNQRGVDELLAMLDVVGLMDWYVNIHDHLPKIEALLQVCPHLTALLCSMVPLHLNVTIHIYLARRSCNLSTR